MKYLIDSFESRPKAPISLPPPKKNTSLEVLTPIPKKTNRLKFRKQKQPFISCLWLHEVPIKC